MEHCLPILFVFVYDIDVHYKNFENKDDNDNGCGSDDVIVRHPPHRHPPLPQPTNQSVNSK